MRKQFNDSGFLSLTIILAVSVLAVGLVGWFVFRAQNHKSSPQSTTTTNPSTKTKTAATEEQPAKTDTETKNTAVKTPPPPPPAAKHCTNGTQVMKDGKPVCSFKFTAKDVPARAEIFALQTNPSSNIFGDVSIRVTCVTADACQKMSDGTTVANQTADRIDWKIVSPTDIITETDEVNTNTSSVPPRSYTFTSFSLDHPANPICTADHWYCYSLTLNFQHN